MIQTLICSSGSKHSNPSFILWKNQKPVCIVRAETNRNPGELTGSELWFILNGDDLHLFHIYGWDFQECWRGAGGEWPLSSLRSAVKRSRLPYFLVSYSHISSKWDDVCYLWIVNRDLWPLASRAICMDVLLFAAWISVCELRQGRGRSQRCVGDISIFHWGLMGKPSRRFMFAVRLFYYHIHASATLAVFLSLNSFVSWQIRLFPGNHNLLDFSSFSMLHLWKLKPFSILTWQQQILFTFLELKTCKYYVREATTQVLLYFYEMESLCMENIFFSCVKQPEKIRISYILGIKRLSVYDNKWTC